MCLAFYKQLPINNSSIKGPIYILPQNKTKELNILYLVNFIHPDYLQKNYIVAKS